MTLPAAAPGRAGKALAGRQSRVRLHEVGPRLELEIVKVGCVGESVKVAFFCAGNFVKCTAVALCAKWRSYKYSAPTGTPLCYSVQHLPAALAMYGDDTSATRTTATTAHNLCQVVPDVLLCFCYFVVFAD